MLPLDHLLPAEVLAYRGLTVRRGWRYAARSIGVLPPPNFRTPLLNAIARGDVDAVAGALASLPDVATARFSFGWTALHFACRAGSAAIVEMLLALGCDPNEPTEERRRPFVIALDHGQHAVMRALLAWPSTHVSEEMLFAAVERNDLEAVRMLLKRDPSCASDDAVFVASQHGNLAMVEALLATGVPIVALHLALSPTEACMTALLMRGVSPHETDKYGVTVTHLAAAFGSAASLRALIAFDPSVLRKTTKEGHSALDLAVAATREECVELIVAARASDGKSAAVEPLVSDLGFNPLCVACSLPSPSVRVVEALCRGMEFDSSLSATLQTPLHLARHSPAVTAVLRAHGCRINKHGLQACTLGIARDMWQQWWRCVTCGLVDNMGVCVFCADTCHAGHELEGPLACPFFCDCGCAAAAKK